MARIFVLPATPLPPTPLPSMAAISPVTNVPWPTRSVTSLPPTCGVVDARDRPAAGELGMAHVEAGVEHGDRAARAAACRGQRLACADVVVEPGELEVAVRGVGRVEGVGGDPQLGVALDVGHARVRRRARGRAAAPDGTVAASTPIGRRGLGPGAERAQARRHTGEVACARGLRRAHAAGRGRGRSASARARRSRPTRTSPGSGSGRASDGAGRRPAPASSRSASRWSRRLEKVRRWPPRTRPEAAPRRAPSRAPLFASLPIVGDEDAGSATLRRSCCPEISLGPIDLQTFGICLRVGVPLLRRRSSAGALRELGKPPDWTYEAVFAASGRAASSARGSTT